MISHISSSSGMSIGTYVPFVVVPSTASPVEHASRAASDRRSVPDRRVSCRRLAGSSASTARVAARWSSVKRRMTSCHARPGWLDGVEHRRAGGGSFQRQRIAERDRHPVVGGHLAGELHGRCAATASHDQWMVGCDGQPATHLRSYGDHVAAIGPARDSEDRPELRAHVVRRPAQGFDLRRRRRSVRPVRRSGSRRTSPRVRTRSVSSARKQLPPHPGPGRRKSWPMRWS